MDLIRMASAILAISLLCSTSVIALKDESMSAPQGLAFPEGEAGISAYINTNQKIDLEKLKTIYSRVDYVGDNYIIGVVPIADWGGDIDVHVYADTDGWLVAYLKKDEPVSGIMQWGDADTDNPSLGVIKSTTLEDALYKAGDAAKVGIVDSDINYYDFEFPNANKMTIIAKTQPTSGSSIHQLEMPADYTLYDAAYYHYILYYSYEDFYKRRWWADSILKVDGATISDAVTEYKGDEVYTWWRALDQYKGAISTGKLHTIEISHDGTEQGSSGVATVLIYRVP